MSIKVKLGTLSARQQDGTMKDIGMLVGCTHDSINMISDAGDEQIEKIRQTTNEAIDNIASIDNHYTYAENIGKDIEAQSKLNTSYTNKSDSDFIINSSGVHKTLSSGLYLVCYDVYITDISNNSGTISFSPLLVDSSNKTIILQDIDTRSQAKYTTSGSDLHISDCAYVNASTKDVLFCLKTSGATGASFSVNIDKINIYKINTSGLTASYASIRYKEYFKKYGFQDVYPIGVNFNTYEAQSMRRNLNEPFDLTLEPAIDSFLSSLQNGGIAKIPATSVVITDPIKVTVPNTGLIGEIWAYTNDKAGIYSVSRGSRLLLSYDLINGIEIENSSGIHGCKFEELSIQGAIYNTDTRGLCDYSNPMNNNGIVISSGNIDHGYFHRLAFNWLSSCITAVSANSILDNTILDTINIDMCDVGMFLKCGDSSNFSIKNCIIEDTSGHGVIIDCQSTNIINAIFENIKLLRNCGGITDTQKAIYNACSLYANKVNKSHFNNISIINSGVWNYYNTDGSISQTLESDAHGMILNGDYNYLSNCDFEANNGKALVLTGDSNIIDNCSFYSKDGAEIIGDMNIIRNSVHTHSDSGTGSFIITGDYNQLMNLSVTKSISINGNNNKIIGAYKLNDSDTILELNGDNNEVWGISSNKIIDNGTGNIIYLNSYIHETL